MARINFKEFKIYTGISQKETRTLDIREALSDGMYMTMRGIKAHDIALRIYRSEGEIELSEGDLAVIREYAKNLTPVLIDSLSLNITDDKQE